MSDQPANNRVVRRASAISGALRMPSDKSISHRALIANAIGRGEATVHLTAPGADVMSTVECLRALGVEIRTEATESGIRVHLVGAPELPAGARRLECGNSGTTMRLLAGVAASRLGPTLFDGDASLRRRPMERVAAPLRAMGARASTTAEGTAPFTVEGARPLRAMEHRLPVASAQVLGAILLAGLAADGETVIQLTAAVRDHSERMLGWMGADVERDSDGLETRLRGPAELSCRSMRVGGDPSSAAAWMVAAAISPGSVLRLSDLALNPSRLALVDLLRDMGASLTIEAADNDGESPEPVGDVVVHGADTLQAISVGGARSVALIDELPLAAIAMASAGGASELRDAAELRFKETDRIAAVSRGLAAIGARVEELPDGWRISRGTPRAARIATGGDHRIAIAFAIAAATGIAGEVALDDVDCVAVSYPTFWDDLARVSSPAGVVA